MGPRTLTVATAVLVAGCFVDNRPYAASASVTGNSDSGGDTTHGPTGNPTTGTAPGSSDTGEPGTTGAASTGPGTTTSTTDPATTTLTSEPATTAPATTDPPPPECQGLAKLGGVATLPACAGCIQTSCCEPFAGCASTDACIVAWACISAQPCKNQWPSCPGVAESAATLLKISDCIQGPCAEVCLVDCVPQTSACAAEPQCGALEACLGECTRSCMPDDAECLGPCADTCFDAHPNGFDLWQAKATCLGAECD